MPLDYSYLDAVCPALWLPERDVPYFGQKLLHIPPLYKLNRFGAFESAQRLCQAFDEVKQCLRPRARRAVSLSKQRENLIERVNDTESGYGVTL
jgi:hypothetical protein